MLFFFLQQLSISKRVYARDFILGLEDVEAVAVDSPKFIEEKPKCQIFMEIPKFKIFASSVDNGRISIDPSIEGSSIIASELLKNGFSSSLFLDNSTYFISDGSNVAPGFNEIEIPQKFDFLKKAYGKFNVYSKNKKSVESICSAEKKSNFGIFVIILILVICTLTYLYTSHSIRIFSSKISWWIFDQNGKIIFGPPPTTIDSVSFSALRAIAMNSLKRKIPTARINSVVRNEDPIKYKWLFAFPMVNKTVLATLCSEILSEDKSINLTCKFENYNENVTEPVISYTSPRDSKPVRINYLDKNNVNCTIYLPADVLVPFQPFGSLTTIISSTFADIKRILLQNQYTESNFFRIVESLCVKLGINHAIFFDGKKKPLFEYAAKGLSTFTEDEREELLSKVSFSSTPGIYNHVIEDKDFAFTYCLSTSSFSISVVLVLDHDNDNIVLVDFALPLVSSCCVYLYFLSYTKEQSLKFERFVNLFTTSKNFALIEADRQTQKLLLMKSSLITRKLENVDQLLEELTKISKESAGFYIKECRNLPKGGSIKYPAAYMKDSDRWFTISGVATADDDSIITLLIEEVTSIKKQEEELNNAIADLQLAMKTLGMKKFYINEADKSIHMVDDELFKQLNVDAPEDLALIPVVHPNDAQKLNDISGKRITVRLINSEEKQIWYSAFSDGNVGFLFCVNELVEMRNKLQTTGKGLALVTSSSLVLWSVQLVEDNVKPLLQQPTIWDALSIDRNTKFSRFVDFLHEEDRENVVNAIENIKEGRISQWTGEARLLKVGNYYEWHKIIFALAENSIMHCLAVNIHGQKTVEIELVETQRLMDILLSSGKLMLWEFIDSNEELPETSEFKPGIDSRLRMSWPFVDRQIPEDNRGMFKLRMTECFNEKHGNGTFEMNIPLIFKTGQIYVSARGKLNSTTGVVQGVCIDITDLTNTLTELEEQNKKAEEANKQKTVFLANMSHEIRTPMNGIFGILDIIASQELTTEQRVLIDSIRSSSFQLMKLLDDTLNLTKIEQGDIENNPTMFNFGSVVEPIFIGTASRARMNHVKFHLQIDRQFPLIGYADQQLFVQVLNNLLSNALKFTKSGYICVRLGWNVIGSSEICVLEVTDTGIGISEEQQRVIFERFSQADPSVMRKFGGTGLGLSLVQEIVRYLGGTINLKSASGKGSQFHVEIPMQSVFFFYSPPFTDHKKHIVMLNATDSYLEQTIKDWVTTNNYVAILFKKVDDILIKMQSKDEIVEVVFIEGQNDLSRRVLQVVGSKPNPPALCSLNEPEEPSVFPNKLTKPIFPHHFLHFLNTLRFGHMSTPVPLPKIETESSNMKILVAEDNKANQFVMKKILQNIGVSFCIADNGREAINMLEKQEFNMIFMDCQMPVLDGISATKEIRASQGKPYKDITIVALTASAVEGDEDACLSAGMDAYLAKPVRIQQITDIIKRFGNGPLQ